MGQALHCFKLSLMSQCIRRNDFSLFIRLYTSMWPVGYFDLSIHAPIIRELCLLIEWIIDPIYSQRLYPNKFKKYRAPSSPEKTDGHFQQYDEINECLFEDLSMILSYLQINIGYQLKTLVKLLRVFKIVLKDNSLKIEWNMLYKFKKIIKEIMKNYLLPACTLH
jgi:hypothetical protein